MSIESQVKKYLHQHRVSFYTLSSETATEPAPRMRRPHCCAHRILRTMLVQIDNQFALVLVERQQDIDLDRLKIALKARTVRKLSPEECGDLFPDCDVSAIPALGSAFDLPVYCGPNVLNECHICFNPGTHDEIVMIATEDFKSLVRPRVGQFAKTVHSSEWDMYI